MCVFSPGRLGSSEYNSGYSFSYIFCMICKYLVNLQVFFLSTQEWRRPLSSSDPLCIFQTLELGQRYIRYIVFVCFGILMQRVACLWCLFWCQASFCTQVWHPCGIIDRVPGFDCTGLMMCPSAYCERKLLHIILLNILLVKLQPLPTVITHTSVLHTPESPCVSELQIINYTFV